jgi:methylated-DNA-protein-cysteine methyltransferase related protein
VTPLEEAIVATVQSLREGEVVTYGEVAEMAGYPGRARVVGNVLQRYGDMPWWRVVTANGRLVPGHEAEHAKRLAAEGIFCRDGHVLWPDAE